MDLGLSGTRTAASHGSPWSCELSVCSLTNLCGRGNEGLNAEADPEFLMSAVPPVPRMGSTGRRQGQGLVPRPILLLSHA